MSDYGESASVDEIFRALQAIAREEIDAGGEDFLGWPDRWHKKPLYRCAHGHVSDFLLRSDRLGRLACLECMSAVVLTFPEDVDGPLDPSRRQP